MLEEEGTRVRKRETRVRGRGLRSSLVKPSGKERRMTRKGSIFLPSTSVLDSDKWRPPFSKLSKRTTLLLFLRGV